MTVAKSLPVLFLLLANATRASADPPVVWLPTTGVVTGPAEPVALAPDGSWIAFVSKEEIADTDNDPEGMGRVQVWNLKTGTLDRTFPAPGIWRSGSVIVSPDGKWLAYPGHKNYVPEIRIHNFQTGKFVLTIPKAGDSARPVGFSADGTELYSTPGSNVIGWSTTDGSKLREVKLPSNYGVTLNSDGKTAIVNLNYGMPHELWDLAKAKKLVELSRPSVGGTRPVFVDGGKKVALLIDSHRPEFRVWDLTGKQLDTLKMPTREKDYPIGRAVSDDLSATAVLEYSGDLKVFDAGKTDPRFTFPIKSNRLLGPVFTPDGKRIVVVDGYTRAWVLDAVTGQPVHTLEVDYRSIKSLAFADGGKLLVAGVAHWPKPQWLWSGPEPEGYVMTWDTSTGELKRTATGVENILHGVYPSPKGEKAMVVTKQPITQVEWWDLTAGKRMKILAESDSQVNYFSGSADGKKFGGIRCTRGQKPEIWMFSPATGERLPDPLAKDSSNKPQFTPDGEKLLISDEIGVRMFPTGKGKPVTLWKSRGNADEHPLPEDPVPLPDGESFVAFRFGPYKWQPRELYYFDIGREVKFGKTDVTVGSIAVSPNGKWVAVGGQEQNKLNPVYLWQLPDLGPLDEKKLADGKPITSESLVKRVSLDGHLGEVFAITFSPDSKTLVTGGRDHLIRFWDVNTGKLKASLCAFPPTDLIAAPRDWVAFTPNGFHAGTARGRAFLRFADGDDAKHFKPDSVQEALQGK